MYVCTDTEVEDIVEDTYYRGKYVATILETFYDGFVNELHDELEAEPGDCFGFNDLLTDDQIDRIITALGQIAEKCEEEPAIMEELAEELDVGDLDCLTDDIQEIICFLQQKAFVKDTKGHEVNIHCWY